MYATQDDMVLRFGAAEVIALTDRNNSGRIDDAVLARALDSASSEIDGYLAVRYLLPFATTPKILTGYACDIARYRLCGAATQTSLDIRERFRDAQRFLELVAAGTLTLGRLPAGGSTQP